MKHNISLPIQDLDKMNTPIKSQIKCEIYAFGKLSPSFQRYAVLLDKICSKISSTKIKIGELSLANPPSAFNTIFG